MITRQWWLGLFERAVKTFCQALIATLVAGQGALNLLATNWHAAVGIAVSAAVLSVLTTLAGIQVVTGNAPTNDFTALQKAPVPAFPFVATAGPGPNADHLTQPIPRVPEEPLDTPT